MNINAILDVDWIAECIGFYDNSYTCHSSLKFGMISSNFSIRMYFKKEIMSFKF